MKLLQDIANGKKIYCGDYTLRTMHSRDSCYPSQLMAWTGQVSIASWQLQDPHWSGPITVDFSSSPSSNTVGQTSTQWPHPMQSSASTIGFFINISLHSSAGWVKRSATQQSLMISTLFNPTHGLRTVLSARVMQLRSTTDDHV